MNPWASEGLFNIDDVTSLTIERAQQFFDSMELSREQQQIAEPILKEMRRRLGFMMSVGLGYLTLSRATATLSGGEAQRIRLATQVGSGLVGCCYVLDEPTIGLHQRDNDRLIRTLRHLPDIGNTVLVVEHDEDTIRAADYLIDIGPGPGSHGGRIVAEGKLEEIAVDPNSLTGKYLSHELEIPLPEQRRDVSEQDSLWSCRRPGKQPQEHRRGLSAGRHRLRHRRVGVGQDHAGQPDSAAAPADNCSAHATSRAHTMGSMA